MNQNDYEAMTPSRSTRREAWPTHKAKARAKARAKREKRPMSALNRTF